MLLKTAIRIICYEKEKLAAAVSGVALAVFLVVTQWGFYFGYQRDITVVLDAFDADVWIVPKGQPMLEGYTNIDDLAYWQARRVQGIAQVAQLVYRDTGWRTPNNGGKDIVQVLGVQFDAGIACSLQSPPGDLALLLRPDGNILVGTKDKHKLGIEGLVAEGLEIGGRRAKVVGFVDDVHLFTTAGFVMTDLDNARAFLQIPPSHVTYVVCKCAPGADVARTIERLQAAIPEHDVLATPEWHAKSKQYWETRSGFGPVILLSSVLAVVVGSLIVMLTFYISTIEKIPVYACLKALGGSTMELVAMLAVQVVVVFVLGAAVAGVCVGAALAALRQTDISVVITPPLILGALGSMFLCSAVGALFSVRKLSATEPGEAFRT